MHAIQKIYFQKITVYITYCTILFIESYVLLRLYFCYHTRMSVHV